MIGEITCEKMIVALNKIDQIDEGKRDKEIAKVHISCVTACEITCTVTGTFIKVCIMYIHTMYILLKYVYTYIVNWQMSKRITRTLESTKFKGVSITPVSAKPGGQEVCIITRV